MTCACLSPGGDPLGNCEICDPPWRPCPDNCTNGEIQISDFTDDGMTRVDPALGPVRQCATCDGIGWVGSVQAA